MSLQFSNAALKSGIVERLRRKTGTDTNTAAYPIEEIVSDVNAADDAALLIVFGAGGKWQMDDPNQVDLPVIKTDLIAGQRAYTFFKDQSMNVVLDFFKILIADQYGFYRESVPVDPKSEPDTQQFWNGQDVQGIPWRHAIVGNAIEVDPIPSFTTNGAVTGHYGIKAYINRESTRFVAADTAKYPSIAGILHEWYVLHAAYAYSSRNNLEVAGGRLRNGAYTGILAEVMNMKTDIENYYGTRNKAVRGKANPRITRFK